MTELQCFKVGKVSNLIEIMADGICGVNWRHSFSALCLCESAISWSTKHISAFKTKIENWRPVLDSLLFNPLYHCLFLSVYSAAPYYWNVTCSLRAYINLLERQLEKKKIWRNQILIFQPIYDADTIFCRWFWSNQSSKIDLSGY